MPPSADALNLLWRDIVLKRDPNYGDWDYPGQAYRHLLAEYKDARKKALLDAAAVICQHCRDEMLEGRLVVEYDDEIEEWVHEDWYRCDAAAIHELINLEAK